MRRLLFTAVLLVAALFLLPMLWPQDISHESAEGAAETAAVSENETVTVQIDGKPTELTLESYVEGVTAAEIPADFPREALRAQAVAARTYALCKLARGRRTPIPRPICVTITATAPPTAVPQSPYSARMKSPPSVRPCRTPRAKS